MKKLIITAILATFLPAYLVSAEDTGAPADGKPKQCQGKGQGGKCNGKNGNGKPKKKGKPGANGAPNNQ